MFTITADLTEKKLTSIFSAYVYGRTPFPINPSAEVADGILESCAVTAELYPAERYWADSI